MSYELAFWVLLASVITYIASHTKIYIGYDEKEYETANIGLLLKK